MSFPLTNSFFWGFISVVLLRFWDNLDGYHYLTQLSTSCVNSVQIEAGIRWPNSLSLIRRELIIGIACAAWSVGEMGMPLLGELKILNYSLQYLRLVLSVLEVDQDSFSDSSFCLLRLLEARSRVAKMAGLQVENERGSGDLVKDRYHKWRSCT